MPGYTILCYLIDQTRPVLRYGKVLPKKVGRVLPSDHKLTPWCTLMCVDLVVWNVRV